MEKGGEIELKISNRLDLYIILMLTTGVPICTIIPQLNLPSYIMYPVLAIGMVIVILGIPASFVRLNYNRQDK